MERGKGSGGMGRGISGVKRYVAREAAVAGIVILLVFAAGCSGDLLGYIEVLVAQGECGGLYSYRKRGRPRAMMVLVTLFQKAAPDRMVS